MLVAIHIYVVYVFDTSSLDVRSTSIDPFDNHHHIIIKSQSYMLSTLVIAHMLSRIDLQVAFSLLIVRLSFACRLIGFAAYESWLNAVCIVTA